VGGVVRHPYDTGDRAISAFAAQELARIVDNDRTIAGHMRAILLKARSDIIALGLMETDCAIDKRLIETVLLDNTPSLEEIDQIHDAALELALTRELDQEKGECK
jgi:hypothetical protein